MLLTARNQENVRRLLRKRRGGSSAIGVLLLVGILLAAIMPLFMYVRSTDRSRYYTAEGIVVGFHSIGSLIFVILEVYYSLVISRARTKYVPRKPEGDNKETKRYR